MTSEGTCKFDIPLSEFTIYSGGCSAKKASISALIIDPSGIPSRTSNKAPNPEFGLTPAAWKTALCFSKIGLRYAVTA